MKRIYTWIFQETPENWHLARLDKQIDSYIQLIHMPSHEKVRSIHLLQLDSLFQCYARPVSPQDLEFPLAYDRRSVLPTYIMSFNFLVIILVLFDLF